MTQVDFSESVPSPVMVTPPAPPPLSKRPSVRSTPSFTIRQLVKDAYAKQASDIHLRVGEPARYRVRGQMIRQSQPAITPEMFDQFLVEILTPEQRDRFYQEKELDTAIYYPGFLRCRVNCF